MTKLELMTVLMSLDKLHEAGKPELAHEVIKGILEEARSDGKGKKQSND